MATAAPSADSRTNSGSRRSGRQVDGIELVILLGFAALSMWVLALDLRQVIVRGLSWTGTDGIFVTDQMTYLAWIRDSSQHVLVSNLFELRGTPADFFEPLIVLSGAVAALGVVPWLSLLLWKPVAVVGLMLSTRALVHRTVPTSCGRRVAIGLALFFVGPGAFEADRLLHSDPATSLRLTALTFDLSLGFWSWGYSFGLISVAAAVLGLLIYARAQETDRHRWAPPLLGALASSLHPWQGAGLILVLIGAEVMTLHRERQRLRLLMLTVAVAAAPLVYFLVLNRSDPSWGLAQSSAHSAFPLWMVAVTVAPLALPALLAYRQRATTFLARAIRLWPVAALVIFLLSETNLGAAPSHALLGISVPLAILAVEGVRSAGWGENRTQQLVIAGLIAITFLPPTVYELGKAKDVIAPGSLQSRTTDPVFVTPGERGALDYLARDPQPGGVMSGFYLGTLVPGLTGRHTFVGNVYYSPDFAQRVEITGRLLASQLDRAAAVSFLRGSGARFLLADCGSGSDLQATLGPILDSVHRFGCVTVYVLHSR